MMMTPEEKKYIEKISFPFCPDISKYTTKSKVGHGTFGEVFKAEDSKTKEIVALKKVLVDKGPSGFPVTTLREILILQRVKHRNIVRLLEVCGTTANASNAYRSTFFLVFEFCDHDLAGILANPSVQFNLGQIKSVIKQLLEANYYIHSNKILHRDMKTSNILVTRKGIVKLADFGLARPVSANINNNSQRRYTAVVVTLWYRPPELLLGDRNYGPPMDLWGVGCIAAELWTRSPILKGATEQQQITLISQLCGSITDDEWPGVKDLALYKSLILPRGLLEGVKDKLKPHVKDRLGLDLLEKLLTLDPSKRLDADGALNHEFFWSDPMPSDFGVALKPHVNSMLDYLTPGKDKQSTSAPVKPMRRLTLNKYHDRIF